LNETNSTSTQQISTTTEALKLISTQQTSITAETPKLTSIAKTATTTTLSPWDQAYIEVFGHLPSEFQYSNTPTIPETSTAFPIIVDGPSPELTYQLKNGTVIILGNLTNGESTPSPNKPATQPSPTQGCQDRGKNCGEMRAMCNTYLYSDTLAAVS
jgi:hypothetical protein